MYVMTDENTGRICATTGNKNYSEGMIEFDFPSDFDYSRQKDYCILGGNLVYAPNRANKTLSQCEVLEVIAKTLLNDLNIPDQTAVLMKSYYPTFEEIAQKGIEDRTVKEGFKVYYNGELWKTRQATVIQSIYPPGIETTAIWERIDEEHAGTLEDPIPYNQTMTVYKDKYYIFDSLVYLCLRDSGNPLYADPDALLDNYFRLVQLEVIHMSIRDRP